MLVTKSNYRNREIPPELAPDTTRFCVCKCDHCGRFTKEDEIRISYGRHVCLSCIDRYQRNRI